MLNTMMKFLLTALLFCASFSFASIDTIDVDVGISVFKTMPIGIVPFGEAGDFSKLEEKPGVTIANDLNLSGRFSVVPAQKFALLKFSRERAKFYIAGRLDNADNGRIKISCYLYASQTKDLMLGEAYTVSPLHRLRRLRESMPGAPVQRHLRGRARKAQKSLIHNTQRNIMNKLTTLFLTATLTAASAIAAPASKTPAGNRTLIVYFSRTGENYSVGTVKEGNTSILAKMIAEQTKGTLFEVKPAKQYPADYKTTCDLAKKELNDGARPAILGDVRDFAAYDTVFIGYPVWWGDLPMAMYTFIEKHNFAGKVVIPFN